MRVWFTLAVEVASSVPVALWDCSPRVTTVTILPSLLKASLHGCSSLVHSGRLEAAVPVLGRQLGPPQAASAGVAEGPALLPRPRAALLWFSSVL